MVYAPDFPCRSVGRPITLDPVACDFPELKLIGIHVGIPWHDEMIAMAWKHKNVYIGCDAHRPKYWPAAFTHYINSFGQDKVIFGTDFPVLPFKRTVEDIDGLGSQAGGAAQVAAGQRDADLRAGREIGRLAGKPLFDHLGRETAVDQSGLTCPRTSRLNLVRPSERRPRLKPQLQN